MAQAYEAETERTRVHLAFRGIQAEVRHASDGTYGLADEAFREHRDASRRGILVGFALQSTISAIRWRMGRRDHYDRDRACHAAPRTPSRS